jgi:hypothetical protein
MYRHTTFAFYDLQSFFAFSASILLHCLHSIRHLNLNFRALRMGTRKDYNDPFSEIIPYIPTERTLPFIAINHSLDFKFIRRSDVQVLNQLSKINCVHHPTSWDAACRILGAMKGLRRLELVIDKSRFFLEGGDAESRIFWPLQSALYERVGVSTKWPHDLTEPISVTWVDGRFEWRTMEIESY